MKVIDNVLRYKSSLLKDDDDDNIYDLKAYLTSVTYSYFDKNLYCLYLYIHSHFRLHRNMLLLYNIAYNLKYVRRKKSNIKSSLSALHLKRLVY